MQVTINVPDNLKSLPLEQQEAEVLRAYRKQNFSNRELFLESLKKMQPIETDMTDEEIYEMIDKERQAVWEQQQAKAKT